MAKRPLHEGPFLHFKGSRYAEVNRSARLMEYSPSYLLLALGYCQFVSTTVQDSVVGHSILHRLKFKLTVSPLFDFGLFTFTGQKQTMFT